MVARVDVFSFSSSEPSLKILEGLVRLKGQCHKMVVEVRPWSGSLALN
jgi:hypothetical protein